MKRLRKALTITVMMVTVLSMSMVAVPLQANAAAQAGDLIKMSGLSSVYYLGGDGKRYVFPNEQTYFSWYSDFSSVVTIPQSELETYPLGANVTIRPGTKLVKITTDPKVYAVESDGILKHVPSEATAIALYGADWAKRVVDVSDAFFTNYTVSTGTVSATAYPEGSLIKAADASDVYYIASDGTARKIASEAAFLANRFKWSDIITTTLAIPTAGTAIAASESTLIDTSSGAGGVAGAGTGLTVSLASDTPAASSVPKNTSVSMMKINLTASNDGDVSVTGITFTAAGLSMATEITAISAFSDGKRLNSTAKNIDSNKVAQLSFSNPLVVKAGATVKVEVKATVTGIGNYALSVKSASDISTNGAAVSGSFPVTGNVMAGVDVAVGELTFNNDGTLAKVKLGDKAATLAKFKVTNDNVEDVTLSSIILKRDTVSTAADDDFENMELYMDGVAVAKSTGISGRYATFTFSTPTKLLKNTVKRFVVKGDVVDGASKALTLKLDATSDLSSKGDFYGYSAKVVNQFTGSSVEIDAGTVTIEKVNAPTDKINKDTLNVEFGTFKITVNSGKNVELSRLLLTIDSVNDAGAGAAFAQIENLEVYNKTNNTTYDLAYVSGAGSKIYSNTSMGLILQSGVTNELVVRADTKSTATDGDYTVKIASAYTSASAQDVTLKEVGNDTLLTDITPNSVSLKKVEVLIASVAFSRNALSAAFNAVVGSADVEIINFNVKAGESSAVKMTQLKFIDAVADNGTPNTITNSVVSEFKLWKGATLLKTVSASQLSSEEITFPDLAETILSNITIAYKVTTSLVKDSNLNGNTLQYRLSGYSVEETNKGAAVYDSVAEDVSANGVVADSEAGFTSLLSARVVTFVGTGALYVSMDTSDSAVSKDIYSVANTTTSGSIAALKMRAQNEPIKITELVVRGSKDLNGIVTELALYDGTTLVGSTNVIARDSVINISGDKLIVPVTSKNYYLKATLAKIGKDATGSLNENITFTVKGIKAQGTGSGDSLGAADDDTDLESGEIGYDVNNDGIITASGTTTGASKALGILASRISSVTLVASASGASIATKIYSGQAANAAIIAVTADASSNTEATGDAIKTYLSAIKVKVATSTTISTYTATIERIGGGAGATGFTVAGNFAQKTGLTTADYEVAPGATAYFLVKVTPTFSTSVAGDSSITVSLDKLDGADGDNDADGANFTFKDASTAAAKYPLRLIASTVDGTTISN
ncbi:MAG: hypothetical protein Q8N21_02245 [bacterium]|nr:hypothetical protein [bacterium]